MSLGNTVLQVLLLLLLLLLPLSSSSLCPLFRAFIFIFSSYHCYYYYYYYYYHYYHHHHHYPLYEGIYTYIPETIYVPREYSVAAILLLLFMVLISLVSVLNLLCFYISTSRSVCAVPNMAVFCSSLTSCFPGMLLTYFLNDFEIASVAPIITGITFVFYSPHYYYY